ncbi:MAG: alanine racemase [Coriobacteriia bacterium]|nr:alanine racemase [Coriobacteriia bacterium]
MSYRRYAWVEVDEAAITANVRTLKALTPKGTRFMAVVKADGYGHGALQAARAALTGGADRLGVATVEEAVGLREAGVTAPLHIVSEPPASAAGIMLEQDIVSTVATKEFAAALSKRAMLAQRPARYHLKIDTGMNRIGVRAEEAADLVAWLKGLPALEMEGVFTHFATADIPGDWEFDHQVERFVAVLERLRTEGVRPPVAHAANSAATILHPEAHFDMVRCGIAIYGLHPSPATYSKVDLAPAMSVKARVSFVKRVGLGDGVSYGLTWHAGAPTTVATLPLGYADGVHRALSNKMDVLIGGRRCQQIGRVCMDQLMVEVPSGLTVVPGDEVVLVGSQGGERILMDELAEKAGTINYESACSLSRRMERRYV